MGPEAKKGRQTECNGFLHETTATPGFLVNDQQLSIIDARTPKSCTQPPYTPLRQHTSPVSQRPIQHLPPTPDATPTKPSNKRKFNTLISEAPTPSTPTKPTKPLLTRSPLRFTRTPKFSRFYVPPAKAELKISGTELKRVVESMLKQTDWDLLEEDVAANRRGDVYRRIIRDMLQEKIDEIDVREEGVEGL